MGGLESIDVSFIFTCESEVTKCIVIGVNDDLYIIPDKKYVLKYQPWTNKRMKWIEIECNSSFCVRGYKRSASRYRYEYVNFPQAFCLDFTIREGYKNYNYIADKILHHIEYRFAENIHLNGHKYKNYTNNKILILCKKFKTYKNSEYKLINIIKEYYTNRKQNFFIERVISTQTQNLFKYASKIKQVH